MRGVSNIISALFAVAVILIAAHAVTTAYVRYSAELADAAKRSIDRKMYVSGISYGDAECNIDSQRIRLKYTGSNPEYLVRFLCYDARNPPERYCIVPFVQNNVLSAQYISSEFPEEIELNMAACQDLNEACIVNALECVAIGAHTARKVEVFRS